MIAAEWLNSSHLSIFQHVGRAFAEPVAGADVGERRPRVGVPGEILQVDDVAAAFPGRGQGGDAERMHGDVGIVQGVRPSRVSELVLRQACSPDMVRSAPEQCENLRQFPGYWC